MGYIDTLPLWRVRDKLSSGCLSFVGTDFDPGLQVGTGPNFLEKTDRLIRSDVWGNARS